MYPTTEELVRHYLKVFAPQQYGGEHDLDYYKPSIGRQYGGEYKLDYYIPSVRRQRGSGFGSILKNVFSKIVPFAKKYLLPAAKQYVLPQVKEMTKNVATDLLDGEHNFKESFKKHGTEAFKKGARQVITEQLGSGRSRRKSKRKAVGRKTKRLPTKKKKKSENTLF